MPKENLIYNLDMSRLRICPVEKNIKKKTNIPPRALLFYYIIIICVSFIFFFCSFVLFFRFALSSGVRWFKCLKRLHNIHKKKDSLLLTLRLYNLLPFIFIGRSGLWLYFVIKIKKKTAGHKRFLLLQLANGFWHFFCVFILRTYFQFACVLYFATHSSGS